MNVDDFESGVADPGEQHMESGLILDDRVQNRVCRHLDICTQRF